MQSEMIKRVLCLFTCFVGLCATSLPTYIKACSRTDPNLNECAKERAIEAIPRILKGDKKYNIPNLVPLKLPLIEIDQGQLKIKLTDSVLSGLENMVVDDINIDPAKRHIRVVVSSKYLNIKSTYDINGRVLILPIVGHGPANMTFYDGVFDYGLDYDLVTKKDGKQHFANVVPSMKYNIGKPIYQFDNLFNGNKMLAEEMNKFIRENSKEVSKDLGPSISETISQVVTSILKSFLTVVPYDEFLLP